MRWIPACAGMANTTAIPEADAAIRKPQLAMLQADYEHLPIDSNAA